MFYLALNRRRARLGSTVVETSPRLDAVYRSALKRLYRYIATDFDQGSHRADHVLDLQKMDLPDTSVDVFITSHVFEHVPDPALAASELRRVLKPNGVAVVMVPLTNGVTSVPTFEQYHADNTLVRWWCGWDFGEVLVAGGLDVEIAVTDEFADALAIGKWDGPVSDDFDVPSMFSHSVPVSRAISRDVADKLGLQAPYQFVGFVCRRPARR